MTEGPDTLRTNVLLARWRHGLVLTATILVLLYIAYRVESVITPLLVSLMIAYVLNPSLRWVEKRGLPRIVGVILLFVLLGALLTLIVSVIVPATIDQVHQFSRWWMGNPSPVGEFFKNHPKVAIFAGDHFNWDQFRKTMATRWDQMVNYAVTNLGVVLGSTFTILNLLLLIPIYTFFFLWRFDRVVAGIEGYIPRDYRPRTVRMVREIDAVAANFFRGRLICCLFVGVTTGVGFTFIGIPFAWLIGIVVGLLNLIPYVGPVMGIIPSLLIAYLHFKDWQHPLVALVYFSFIQTVDGFVLTPIVQGKLVGLHPITTIVVLLMGGELAGVFGLILAVPAAAAIKILAREFLLPELESPTKVITTPGAGPPAVISHTIITSGSVVQEISEKKGHAK